MSAEKELVERILCMLPIYEFIDSEEEKAVVDVVLKYGEAKYAKGFDDGHNVAAYGEF